MRTATIQIRRPDLVANEKRRRESRAELVRFYRACREAGCREVAMALFHTRKDIEREIAAYPVASHPNGLMGLLAK